MPSPGPGEVPAAAAAPLPALPEFGRAPFPMAEASGQRFQDPAPAEPPKLYPPLPVSTVRKRRETLELSRDCALPESRRERKRTDKRFAMLTAALGKSISGSKFWFKGFPGGSVVKNSPANAGDTDSIPDRGRFHMLQSN